MDDVGNYKLVSLCPVFMDTDYPKIAEEGDEIVLPKWTINAKRKIEKENLQKQAAKILRLSNKKFTPVALGHSVRVSFPEIDR